MSTEFFNDQWRIPSNENQNKISNYSMEFDGTSDFINVGSTTITGSCSISLWFKTSANISLANLTGGVGMFQYLGIQNNKLVAYVYPNFVPLYGSTVNDGLWHNFVFAYDSTTSGGPSKGTFRAYVDGALTITFDMSSTGSQSYAINTIKSIGAYEGGSIRFFNGSIDQVNVFDYELSQDQVTQLGAEGYAFKFNSSRIAVGLENTLNLGGASKYSTSIWFKKTGANAGTAMWGYNYGDANGSGFYYWFTGGDLRVAVGKDGLSSGFAYYTISSGLVPIGKWHHVVMVFDGTETGNDILKVYQNGVVATGTYTNTSAFPTTLPSYSSSRQVYLGQLQLGNGSFGFNFEGELSNVQQWSDTALTLDNAKTLYNKGLPLKTLASIPESSNLEAWWKLDNTATLSGSTWSVPDASANSNTGTSSGMTASSLVASDINGELIANPMITSPKPIAYYQLGDQSVDNGANYLVPNNSLSDYVFNFIKANNSFIDTNSTFTFTSFTISTWFKRATSSGAQYIVSSRTGSGGGSRGIAIYTSGGLIQCDVYNSGSTQVYAGSIVNDVWYNVVMTYDGSVLKGYLNGAPFSGLASKAGVYGPSAANMAVGKYTYTSAPFDGEISNFQTFNTALPGTGSNSVETLYNNGSPRTSMSGFTSLQRWYKLDSSEIFNSTSTEWSVDNNAYPSVYKSSLNFDGTSNSIQVPTSSNLEITGNMTISAWIKPDSSTTASTKIINKRDSGGTNYDFFIETGGLKLKFFDGTSNIPSDITITPDAWNHVAITINSGVTNGSIFYVNGIGQATNLPTFTITSNDAPLTIGKSGQANTAFFDGEISNVSIFNSNLSASNIITLYNNGNPAADISSLSPVGWWKLNNTTTGIEDSAGSNNGTNNGATEYAGFVNALAGESSGMTSSNLVVSDLQQTSGYSPYALDFDGVDNYLDCGTNPFDETTGDITLSAWVKKTSGTGYQPIVAATQGGVGTSTYFSFQFSGTNLLSIFWDGTAGGNLYVVPSSEFTVVNGNWYLINFVRTGTVGTIYVNGSLVSTSTKTYNNFSFADRPDITLGGWNFNTSARLNGELSNVSLWNAALTSAQITEVYNEGVPSNLNNHSAYSNLISWWQLGSNSSFNTNWTVLNEISTGLDGVSQGVMTNDEIVNGPGYSANGLGTSSIDVVGDAPYSTANGLSENMDVLDRKTDVPS